MAGIVGSTSIYLLPGMKAKVMVPRYIRATGTKTYTLANGEERTAELIKGFYLEDPDVGELAGVPGEPAVIYTHKKYAQTKIVYLAQTGERGEVCIISVPIHDHSSLVTGGPAYGTYFTDDESIGES